ncbi:T9SS type A sorting domain-containing protein [Haliscomenobacter sp.]|uniref:T9SS type A sorting domain-containing protein n=1 Tax=Haliscomenobacter sp. TaxID=2717303 RepID=UPI003BAAEA08
MTFGLRSTALVVLCVFMSIWAFAAPRPSTVAPKTSSGLLTHLPISLTRSLPTSLPKPFKASTNVAGNTVRWTGAVSTDWYTPGNWTTVSGTPSIPPQRGSTTGDHVIIPNVSAGSGNFPVIASGTAGARSVTLEAGASLTIGSTAVLEVVGSDADGFTNSGLLTNEGTLKVDSAYNDAFVNKLGAQFINKKAVSLSHGFGNRLVNYGTVNNNANGNFYIDLGVDTALLNYATGVITNNSLFTVSSGNNVRVFNLGTIHNQSGTFSVQGASAGTGVANDKKASIINEGTFEIRGGVGAQLINQGTVENRSGYLSIDGSSFPDFIVHNLYRFINKAAANFSVSGGNGSGFINDSIVVNEGNMSVGSGGNNGTKPRLYNGPRDTIINKGSLSVEPGNYTTLKNYGVVDNSGSLSLRAGSFDNVPNGITLYNKFKVFNRTGATFTFLTGTNDGIVNDSIFINDGTLTGDYGGGQPSFKNCAGDTLISKGNITIQGVGDFTPTPGVGIITNLGYFEFHKNISLERSSNHAIYNAGLMIGKSGSKLSLQATSKTLLYNDAAGQILLNGESEFLFCGLGAIANYGRFQQIGGLLKTNSSLGRRVIANYNYMEISGVPGLIINRLDTLFYNTDTLLFKTTSANSIQNITSLIINKGYFLSQADYYLERLGYFNSVISNSGVFIHDANYLINAKYTASEVPFIENKANSRFYQRGNVTISESSNHAISNAGYYLLSGKLKGTGMGYSGKAVVANSDTLINEGIIETDTLHTGIQNSAYFRNSRRGKIFVDYALKNGIDNTGDLYNFGEIWMARDTGIGGTGIYNSKLFDNCGLINIGQKGPLFGGGIVNAGTGVFSNRPTSNIVIANVDSAAIVNNGVAFNNGLCALIDATGSIVDQSNSFANHGTLVQRQDTIALDADITTNTGTIYDLDPENLVVANNTGQLLSSLPNGGVAPSSISFRAINPEACNDDAQFVVEASCPAGPFDLVISYNGTNALIEDYTSGDTIRLFNLHEGTFDFVLKSIDVDGAGQVEKDIPAVSVSIIECRPKEIKISDPCTCVNNAPVVANGSTTNGGTFSEKVEVQGPSGQTWTIVSVSGLYSDSDANNAYVTGNTIPETGVGTGVYDLLGYHRDGVGYTISVTNNRGDTLSIGNKCFYPDPVFTGLPVLVSPNAAPFTVTGTVANSAAGTGTFILDGNPQAGASAAPTNLTINPATLSGGVHTLVYSFDAGTPGAKDPNDPGCVQQVRQRFQVANCACQDVTVSLNDDCQFALTANIIGDGACVGATVRVMDNNPGNGNIIDCAGVWTYGLFDSFGNILCWGKVTAEDKAEPILLCPPADVTLDCYDVNYVLNNRLTIGNTNTTSSPRPAASGNQTILNAEGIGGDDCGLVPPALVSDNIKNLGYAYFKDNCYSCGCRITLKWSDKVVFYNCDDMKVNGGIYATISREWVATDCNGMSSAYVQKIQFKRPDVRDFVFKDANPEGKYDHVIEYNACTPDKSLIKKEDVTPYVCSYFNNPPSNPRCLFIDQVECNYSVSIKDTEFPICGGKGVKIDRELYVFDWCAGGIVDTFHILIKIGDFEGPTATYAEHAPYVISTGPMDCTAAIPVTVAGIKSAFGVTIQDNCNLGNISAKVYTKDRYVKGILVYEGDKSPFCNNWVRNPQTELRNESIHGILGPNEHHQKEDICWEPVEYAVMNGMMIGLPVGKHLMVIDAFDGCYNSSSFYFVFEVQDKIAPVMKCDDDLHVTLSNANGYTNGYAQVSAADIDEGSWDNCKLAWIAARRNVPTSCTASFIAKGYDTNNNGKLDPLPADGDWTKADGFDRNGDGDLADFGETFILKGGKLMTPLADFVEFFCCDLAERVTVELWGEDVYGNTNYCWMDLLIEDKVAPTCLAPWDVTVYCDDKNLASIDSKVGSAAAFGDITIPSGNDCAALDTVYTTEKKLKCGAGYIDRIWTLTKETVKGPISVTCRQRIHILPVHEYNICFPKDVSTDCKTPIIDTVITDELACDILAVNVSDKRYDASDDECYKIFRTYSVINWCTYDDRCGDPLEQTNIHVIDRGVFGNYGKDPIYLLVRDRENNRRDGDEEFWISKDLTVSPTTDLRAYPYYCDESEEYYHSFIYTQIIKVYDDTRPVVTGDPAEFCIREGADCLANLKMVITGKDNCSDKVTLETQYLMIAPGQTLDASKMILYSTPRWSTKDLGNGQFEINVANLPEGKHDLIVVVRDECGNLSVATRIPFTVKDCKGPAPICINGLSTGIMPDGNGGGMMAVWASDFVASKIYDCNGQGPETKDGLKLVTKYSINRVGQPANKDQTGLNFTCADIANSPILVELHAWDNAGNHDFCITFVELIDSRGVCPGSASGVNIAGTISTEGNANLQGASITLSGAASQSATTAANGGYSFVNLAKGGDFTVTPQLDKNHLNGVSTFDLVLIQKHILGVTALNSPYKMIAADVNNSKTISTLDLIALRKLILNIDTHFANNTSWRFVDASYTFPNANNPWAAAFPEVVSINDIASNVAANFVAIKVGDVNASASVNGLASAEVRTNTNFKLQTLEQNLKPGNEYRAAFTSEDLKNIQGYQFALNLDQSVVELLDIEYGVAKAENFGIFKNEGLITTSWNSKYEPGALFTLVLRAKADAKLSSALSLNRLVHPEAYDQHNGNLGVALNFEGIQATEAYELKQNTPNPFSDETLIGFTLPKATKATLSIRDVKGALVYKVEGNYAKGNNQVTLKKSQLGASGVLYYTLETTDFTATKKMVILD